MTDILITEPMDEPAVASLRAEFSVIHDPDLSEQPQRIAQLARDCRALIVRESHRVTAVLLDGCASLVAIGRLGVGLDNIDMDACKQRDVTVYPASGANADAVAEYVIGSIFLCSRRGLMASAEVLAGDWPRVRYIGMQVSGKTLGIIGLGAIGQALAPRATALGLQVIAYDPLLSENAPAWRKCGVEPRSLASLLADSDFVSLHVPLSAATRNLVNASALGRMRATACLINASRGGIVDETALIRPCAKAVSPARFWMSSNTSRYRRIPISSMYRISS